MPNRLRESLLRQRRAAGRIKFALEWILAIAGIVALVIAIWHHLESNDTAVFPGEGKRVVAFRQVTNRICTENRSNMGRALTDANSRIERLAFVARTLSWDLNDLESITAPPTRFDGFLAELATRRKLRDGVLSLQKSIELGDHGEEAAAIATIEDLEAESRELSRESGIVRCMTVLPNPRELIRN
jgi:hypothetical protein